MDLLHHVYRLLLKGELHCAPITKDPRRVLDLGTGTGPFIISASYESVLTEP
jgi:methylase of polypeptide subunit release factors